MTIHFIRRSLCLGGLLTCLISAGCGRNAPSSSTTAQSAGPTETAPAEISPTAAADDQAHPPVRGNGTLRIAAASDLKFALDALVAAFSRTHEARKITVTLGSSGNLFAQLSNDAPFDLFLAADINYARQLAQQKHASAGGEFPYARGHIVLWALRDAPQDVIGQGIKALENPAVKTIAIANPKTAPYGRAAVEALKSLGVYEAVESRLVYGDSVAQTAQMVESGAADVGIIAQSLAVAPPLTTRGVFWSFPPDSYQPLIQGGVVLSWAEDPALAREFCEFLRSGAGIAILKEFGFDVPGE